MVYSKAHSKVLSMIYMCLSLLELISYFGGSWPFILAARFSRTFGGDFGDDISKKAEDMMPCCKNEMGQIEKCSKERIGANGACTGHQLRQEQDRHRSTLLVLCSTAAGDYESFAAQQRPAQGVTQSNADSRRVFCLLSLDSDICRGQVLLLGTSSS